MGREKERGRERVCGERERGNVREMGRYMEREGQKDGLTGGERKGDKEMERVREK